MSSKSKVKAMLLIFKIMTLNVMTHACGPCTPPYHNRPTHPKHPKVSPPVVIVPPIIITPPLQPPPTIIYPPPAPINERSCPIDALKLGVCLDVLGGVVHVGIGNPVESVCCPVIEGLVDLEAAICLCTVIRAKLLNLNIFLPLALQLLITCGKNPPPGFLCPPL
ncbi:36.4 kDa proline-rich protein-like [Cicer arietinum]|uniref:36.4 kDa proline-rich protein-like n=1 Tax=Cicer arietinum TaxID=3827 RepID=A0A1S2Z893_CICAR|nr:36.4 kDa proline-rich protein-like [Cicer arietinum]